MNDGPTPSAAAGASSRQAVMAPIAPSQRARSRVRAFSLFGASGASVALHSKLLVTAASLGWRLTRCLGLRRGTHLPGACVVRCAPACLATPVAGLPSRAQWSLGPPVTGPHHA